MGWAQNAHPLLMSRVGAAVLQHEQIMSCGPKAAHTPAEQCLAQWKWGLDLALSSRLCHSLTAQAAVVYSPQQLAAACFQHSLGTGLCSHSNTLSRQHQLEQLGFVAHQSQHNAPSPPN